MRRLVSQTLVSVCCLTVVAMPWPSMAEIPMNTVEAEIKAENGRWADAYASGDYVTIGNLYTADGMLLPPGEDRVEGPAAIAAYFRDKSKGAKPKTVRFSNYEFYGDRNMITEISDTEISDHTGKLVSRGKQILIFVKQKGSWKIHRDIWNANAPAKQA